MLRLRSRVQPASGFGMRGTCHEPTGIHGALGRRRLGTGAACTCEDPKVVESRQAAEATDLEIASDLAAPNHAEARDWLRRPVALGFKVSVDEMRTMADELYAAGAITVYVTDIEEFQGREIAAILVLQLPADEPARKRVFEWENAFAKATETEGARDVGQRYLRIILD
jgi:hypothetical protein